MSKSETLQESFNDLLLVVKKSFSASEEIKELFDKLRLGVNKSFAIKDEIITLQEKLIAELSDQNEKMNIRVKNSFRAGFLFGFALAVIVCSIINIVIATIR